MAKGKNGLISKASAEAAAGYSGAKAATAADASGNESPTIGKSIPIISGGSRPKGEVIWCQTRLDKNNACRGDVAICFGRNAFGRPLELRAINIAGKDIYLRKDGVSLDPSSTVRFYDGTHTTADPLIVSVEGAANTPAWKGYIYVVIEDIILLDGDVHAEFTDNGTTGPTQTHLACDPALSGIDLVYDESTRLYYGLKDPMTGASSIITSDGCTILQEVPITSPFGQNKPAPNGYKFWCDKLYPLRCEGMVVISGFTGPLLEEGPFDYVHWAGPTVSPVFSPSTGVCIHTEVLVYPMSKLGSAVPRDGLSAASLYTATDPSATGIEWKVSYRLPEAGLVAYLRIVDAGASLANASDFVTGGDLDFGGVQPVLAGGYLAAQVVNITNGYTRAFDDVGRLRLNTSDNVPRENDYNVRGSPNIDDVVYCGTVSNTPILAGLKNGTTTFTVYVMHHASTGLTTPVTATVTMPTGFTSEKLNYDRDTETILVSASPPGASLLQPRVYSISLTGTVTYSEMASGYTRMLDSHNGIASGGSVPVTNDTSTLIGSMDTATGATWNLYSGAAPAGTPTVDLAANTFSFPTATGHLGYSAAQVTAGDIALSDLITDICALKGYSSGDLVFEGFSGLVARGMTISATTRVADLLNRLGQLYGFVFAETDGKLKFRRRRQADGSVTADVTLTETDLVEGTENITVQREAATNVLGSLALTWLDPDRDYESNNVVAKRITGVLSGSAGTRDEEISLPLALDQATARKLLFESFYAQAEAETRVSFSVGPNNLRIEPGDLIQVTAGGSTRIVQARRVTHRADANTLDIEADTFMAQATPTIDTAGGNTSVTPSGLISGAYIHLDMPLISTPDYPGPGQVRQYHGLTTFDAEQWGGADFYRSADAVNYQKLLDYNVAPLVVAKATNALGDCPQDFALDTVSELTIEVIAGNPADFASVSYLDMMADRTLCAYGRPGAWELLSFQTVTDNLDGTLTLSNLQRGLYGTQMVYYPDPLAAVFLALPLEFANLDHRVGDFVCLLNRALVRSTVRDAGEIGRFDRYAVATADVDVAAAVKSTNKLTGISMRPPPVANIIAEHVAGASTMTITWDAVSPVPHTWEDSGAAAPMPETYTYNILIVWGGGPSDNVAVTATSTTYTWPDYGTTFGATALAPDSVLDVYVTAISPVWGSSFIKSATEIREA